MKEKSVILFMAIILGTIFSSVSADTKIRLKPGNNFVVESRSSGTDLLSVSPAGNISIPEGNLTGGKGTLSGFKAKSIIKWGSFTLDKSYNGMAIAVASTRPLIITLPPEVEVGFNAIIYNAGSSTVHFESTSLIQSVDDKRNLLKRFSSASVVSYWPNAYLLNGYLE